MPGAVTTKTIKDGNGAAFTGRHWDESGAGTGPFSAMPVLSDGEGGHVLDNGYVKVTTPDKHVTVTLTLFTGTYADGDVLSDTQTLTEAVRFDAGSGILQSVRVLDKSDQKQPLEILILDSNTSIGTEGSSVSISDADAEDILGHVTIEAADYLDIGSSAIATKGGIGLGVKAAAADSDLYVACISRGTGTYATDAIQLKLYFLQR